MMQVRVRANGDSDQMKIGGVVIMRPGAAGAGGAKAANPNELP
jgi:hypothetical protein